MKGAIEYARQQDISILEAYPTIPTQDRLPDDLSLWNMDMKRVVESGEFVVQVGAASNDIRLKIEFEVKE